MSDQEKQVYLLMGEIRNNIAGVQDMAHALHDNNRRIGTPPPREKEEVEEIRPEGEKMKEPICITDHLVNLRNSSNKAAKILKGAVEDLTNLV